MRIRQGGSYVADKGGEPRRIEGTADQPAVAPAVAPAAAPKTSVGEAGEKPPVPAKAGTRATTVKE